MKLRYEMKADCVIEFQMFSNESERIIFNENIHGIEKLRKKTKRKTKA